MAAHAGYGKPPEETRFRKGRSGNPGGRPGPRRALEKRFQQALGDALLAKPEALVAREPACAVDALAENLVCGAALAEPEAIGLLFELLPEPGRRVRFPAFLLRALEQAQSADAQSQGNSAGLSSPAPSGSSLRSSPPPAAHPRGGGERRTAK